ncbi:hypothetical protein C6H64_03855 [Photorhabdus luminescens]|uniref:hypothetical protein n=1 Tax=Photorhabdus akhurstii TaxID=171438 RepID=UPI000CF8B933|nr:hypothetical protein [Photorhabdus akhurstii]MBS9429343.1 hypothetical protein [Photorhabdus akhurstii]PQQ32073.1 hypothetical protein C6H64_03855 [Photorhabdus luminescens]PQQ42451.1 hypothetical protein C6H65_03260 [Photorhabdus luminescens]
MTIDFTDTNQQSAQLKKARSVLSLVTNNLPNTDENEECSWAISVAYSIVFDVIEALDKAVSIHLQELREEANNYTGRNATQIDFIYVLNT